MACCIVLLDILLWTFATRKGCPESWASDTGSTLPQKTENCQALMPSATGPSVRHTDAPAGACEIFSTLNFQGNLILLASPSIFKAFQMIKMLSDNAFQFFLIGLLSNKLLIIDQGLQLACAPAPSIFPESRERERQTELGEGVCFFQGLVEVATYSCRTVQGTGGSPWLKPSFQVGDPRRSFEEFCVCSSGLTHLSQSTSLTSSSACSGFGLPLA